MTNINNMLLDLDQSILISRICGNITPAQEAAIRLHLFQVQAILEGDKKDVLTRQHRLERAEQKFIREAKPE